MRLTARSAAIALPLALLAASAGPACAQDVKGFFSRFLPGSDPVTATTAPPAATKPAPVEIPDSPTDANPFNGRQGGLIDSMRGKVVEGCEGVVCNFMGGESAIRPRGALQPGAPAEGAPAATVASVRSPAADDRVSPRKERCTAPANDPWRCFR